MMEKNKYSFSLFVIGALFFMFGFITWLNSILIPFLSIICELKNDFQASFVTFAFYIAYVVMGIPSAWIIKKIGYSNGMILGLLTMTIGSILFVPAATTRLYSIFLVGLFILGIGLAILQSASNPYATILGPIETAARRISLMGICNKVAGMIGIFIIYNALFSDTEREVELLKTMPIGPDRELLLQSLSNQIILPYIIITAVFILLVIFLKLAKLPEVTPENAHRDVSTRSIFSYPYLWSGVLAIFFYVGAEVVAIDYLVRYGAFWGFSMAFSKNFGVYALIALVVGYLLSIAMIPKMISQRKALIMHLILSMILLTIALCAKGMLSVACIIMLSFTHAIMWPAIWPLSIRDLGSHTELGSALLVMAICGGAIIPIIYGKLCDVIGNQNGYAILFVCYLYILFFATKGYKMEGKKQ